jgi:sec-independent protein translocase protein TatC
VSDIDTDIDSTKMPLLEHLVELRKRLLWCFVAFAIAFAVSLYFARPILTVLVHPLEQAGQAKIINTKVFGAFFVEIKVAFFSALMISFPVLATQIWSRRASTAMNARLSCHFCG